MTYQSNYNPQRAGTGTLGQSPGEEAQLIEGINSNRWFIWGWVVLNVGVAFISSMVADNGVGASIFSSSVVVLIMGVPAFFLFRNQGVVSACTLLAFALFNAISVFTMADSMPFRVNAASGVVALCLIILTGMITLDAFKLRKLRDERT